MGEKRGLGESEILKIPPILKILILTKTHGCAAGLASALWIPAFAGMTG